MSLFAYRLEVLPGEDASAVTAQAEDAQGRVYPLTVEHVIGVQDPYWLTQVVVKLPEDAGTARDFWVRVSLRGAINNRALVKVASP